MRLNITSLSNISGYFAGIWERKITGWILWAIFLVICLLWGWNIPSTGYAIALLGTVAAIMSSLWVNFGHVAKTLWVILMFAFVSIEMKAIDSDKQESTRLLVQSFKEISTQANENLKATLQDEHDNFANVLQNQQDHFVLTMKTLSNSQKSQNTKFFELLSKQEQLFRQEHEVSEFLTGKLLPGEDPIPIHGCASTMKDNDVLVLLGGNGYVTNNFPHTILEIHKKPIITINKKPNGSLVLSIDIRDTDNKVIARLNENGFIVNNKYMLYLLRPDKSTILIENEYGEEMLKARFMNPRMFSLSGTLPYQGINIPIGLNIYQDNCYMYFHADIVID